MHNADFCEKLDELCRKHNWSFADLARMTGLSERSCIAYARGETPPSYKFLIGLRDAGIDIGELLAVQHSLSQDSLAVEVIIGQAAQYKATLDAIAAVIATTFSSKVTPSNEEEALLLHAFRAASPKQKALYRAIWEAQDNTSTESPASPP